MTVDLGPAARRMAALVAVTPDEALDAPTPCPDFVVADLLDHIGTFSAAFRRVAAKQNDGDPPPPADGSNLSPDFRTTIGEDLEQLVAAWQHPDAWTGTTRAGGVDLPGEVAGLVALDELLVHGWDLARATGQAYRPGDAELEAVGPFLDAFTGDGGAPGLFGPTVEVAADAPLLDRTLGRTGRDPSWSPA